MECVGYIRVSTQKQVDEGDGLAVQEARVRAWCERNGHHLLRIHVDEALSGKLDAENRPALSAALSAIADGVPGLVIYTLDRAARTLTVQEAMLSQAWKLGATVFSSDIGLIPRDEPDDPMKTAMRQMVGVFSQLEAGLIAYRMRSGRRLKASKGGYAGYGSPRFGQAAEDKELVVDAVEQKTISRMVVLRDEGKSLREIVSALTAERRPAKRGGPWHTETVRRVLARLDAVDEAA